MDFNSKVAANNEPILTVRDVARYRALLLAKRDELLAAAAEAESLAPPTNEKSGDLVDWARADTEADLQIQRRQSDAHLMRAIEDALTRINRGSFGVCEVCKQPISKRGSKPSHGRASVVIARKSGIPTPPRMGDAE